MKADSIPYLSITVSHEVLVTPEGVWDAMLNQTDLGKNANKCATPVLTDHSYSLNTVIGSTSFSCCIQSATTPAASCIRAGAASARMASLSRRCALCRRVFHLRSLILSAGTMASCHGRE